MSSSPAVMGKSGQLSGQKGGGRDERIVVPMKWRIGQAVVIGLILLLAIYFYTKGWQNAPDETEGGQTRTVFDGLGFLILAGLAWLCTPTAGVIAMTTFQEALRRRWMAALLVFALVLLALSTFFTTMQPGTEEQYLRDFGIGFIIIITLLMSIFLGVALVPPDIERRTIFTILSKPVDRLEFLIGKYLGLCLTLFVNLLMMSVFFLIAYTIFKVRHDAQGFKGAMMVTPTHMGLIFDLTNMSKALVLQYGQLIIMAALALMMSLVVSNITAIVFCFLAYFGGQMSSYWEHLSGNDPDDEHGTPLQLSKGMRGIVNAVYYMLPRLDRFDVRERLVTELPIGFNYMWKAMGSGLIYVAVLLTISYLVFSDREF